ncbi:hypothetical protein GCM10020331_022630 [Ectobacillus funiculus]
MTLADQIIRAGDQSLIVAGGMESMSNAPYMLGGARWGYRMGHNEVVDANVADGLTCAFFRCSYGNIRKRCSEGRGNPAQGAG